MWTSPYEPVEVGGVTLPGLVADAGATVARPSCADRRRAGARRLVRDAAFAHRARGRGAGRRAASAPGDMLALWAPNLPQWAGVALGAMAAGGRHGGEPAGHRPRARRRSSRRRRLGARDVPPLAERRSGRAAGRAGSGRARRGGGATPIAAVLERGRRPAPGRDGRGGAAAVLERHDRAAEGRHAHPPKPRHRRPPARAAPARGRARRRAGGRALRARDGLRVTCALPLAAGATVVTMPRFDFERLLGLVERHRVTVLVVPPPVMAALAHHPVVERFDLSSHRARRLRRRAARRRASARRRRAPAARRGRPGLGPDRDHGRRHRARPRAGTVPGSVGRVMPNTELASSIPRAARARPDQDGELWVRGPQNTAGLPRPPATPPPR